LVNSLTQNIAIAVIGMPALLVFGFTDVLVGFSVKYILMAVLLLFAFFVIILFMLPRISKFPFLKNKTTIKKVIYVLTMISAKPINEKKFSV
jgi:hypothetical protein